MSIMRYLRKTTLPARFPAASKEMLVFPSALPIGVDFDQEIPDFGGIDPLKSVAARLT